METGWRRAKRDGSASSGKREMNQSRVTSSAIVDFGVGGEAPSGRELRAAIVSCAFLYAIGGVLCATALLIPHVRAPAAIAAVGIDAILVAVGLTLLANRGHATLNLAFAADLWGVVLIAVLCAGAGGASSPFALIYLFAIGHAAAFQPRRRVIAATVILLVAF